MKSTFFWSAIIKGKSFNEDKYYARQIDKWAEHPDGTKIKVGTVRKGSALNRVGIPAANIYFDIGKIRTAMEKHSDHLSAQVMKDIPALLDDPIVITEYAKAKNTVNVYGDLFVGDTPVVVGVVMRLDNTGQNIISNIRTIHARSDFAKQITDSSVLYLNEDQKRTRSWFQSLRQLTVPLDGTKYGFIRSITFQAEKSKSQIQKNTEKSDEPRYSLKGSETTLEMAQL